MNERSGSARWPVAAAVAALAALALSVGSVAAGPPAGAASSSLTPTRFSVIKFWAASDVVSLTVSEPACDDGNSSCLWMLYVDEPDTPGHTVVGTAVGSSGVLSVAYPADFCGVIQADALRGPDPWSHRIGYRRVIATGPGCPAVPPGRYPTVVPTATFPTSDLTPVSTSQTAPGSGTGTPSGTGSPATTTAAGSAQLPFTGFDVEQVFWLGNSFLLAAFLLLATRQRRFRARRWLARTPPGAVVTRTSRWFAGL